jgi:DNA-binding NtrC family response regulator
MIMPNLNQNVNVKTTPRMRLLLVDDDRYLTEALGANLEARLFDVRIANGTRQGLIELASDSFDAAIVDWLMPDGNGAALLDFAKSHFPEMPIVVYSAHDGADAQSVVAQADGFVLKGGSDEQLFNALDRVLQAAKRREASCACVTRSGLTNLALLFQTLRETFNLPQQFGQQAGFLTGGFWDVEGLHRVVTSSDAIAGECGPELLDCARLSSEVIERRLFGRVDLGRPQGPELERGLLERIGRSRLVLYNADRLETSQQEKLAQSFRTGQIRRSGGNREISIRAKLAVFIEDSEGLESAKKRFAPELAGLIEPDWYDPIREWDVDGKKISQFVQQMLTEAEGAEARLGTGAEWWLKSRFKDMRLGVLVGAIERTSSYRRPTDRIEMEDLPLPWCSPFICHSGSSDIASLESASAQFESLYMARVLSATRGNVSRAVQIAGIGRPAFYSRLRKHKIEPEAFRSDDPSKGVAKG